MTQSQNDTDPVAQSARVALLGEPVLRVKCREVTDLACEDFLGYKARLHATLSRFRIEHGFGRAIAAPQIGVTQRFVAVQLDGPPITMINPEIIRVSHSTFTLWDDCMSFPDLLVRVRRHESIDLRFLDDTGRQQIWRNLERATSELVQHELDHLDGVLALDRARNNNDIIKRCEFAQDEERFLAQVG